MKTRSLLLRLLPLLLAAFSWLIPRPALAQDDDGLPANLGQDLHPLVLWHRAHTKSLQSASKSERTDTLKAQLGRNNRRLQTDADGRVIVRVRLDGSVPAADVTAGLTALGADVTAGHAARRADGRDGTLTVHLPLSAAVEAARLPGVFSVLASHRPRTRAGKVTTQGYDALHVDEVAALGFTGLGVHVGVISDSYDAATDRSAGGTVSTHASDDVASDDLPGLGNPNGHTTPVAVLQEGSTDPRDGSTDEGRAMLQIIHDIAPGAALSFCAVGSSVDEFADNIRSLRTNSRSNCDVIVDDIGFDDEPFFSDGVVSQAVDEVVTSTTLAGHPVAYYSAAGNDGDLSYSSDFSPVSDAVGRASKLGNVRLSSVPDNLTAGGFHNFKAAGGGGGVKIVQKVTVSQADATINFQWDDPFLPRDVTTSYCLLVFDAGGNYVGKYSGIDDNFSIGEALQTAYLPLNSDGSDTTYQLIISRRNGGTKEARHLRYIVEDSGVVIGKYLRTAEPTLYGHAGAANADGVAAFDVHDTTGLPESYNSFGPVTIYFDTLGNRLAAPLTRQQPTIAAVDGVDTTFFAPGDLSDTDSDNDGYPNFFGTSAAAPHAAGVAALLLQAAGGSGSLSAAQLRNLLESSAQDHDLDPAFSVAQLTSADGLINVSVTAAGDDSNNSAFDQSFFTLSFNGPEGSSLRKATIDISPAGEVFDTTEDKGYPFTIGGTVGVVKTDVQETLGYGANPDVGGGELTLAFGRGLFPPSGSVSFGIDRDRADIGSGGNSADLLAGATVTAKAVLADGTKEKLRGTFVNQSGHGWSADVGYGLINARAALQKLTGK